MEINIYKRTIGVNFTENNLAEIVLWAPFAATVEVNFDGKIIALNKAERGYWELTTQQLAPGTKYGFAIDGNAPLPDPASLYQPDGVHGQSAATQLHSFKWTDNSWINPELSNYITYELHTGTFTPQGNFASIEDKLDYLVELGITAVELMPIAQFPGERNWGYDGVFPFAEIGRAHV